MIFFVFDKNRAFYIVFFYSLSLSKGVLLLTAKNINITLLLIPTVADYSGSLKSQQRTKNVHLHLVSVNILVFQMEKERHSTGDKFASQFNIYNELPKLSSECLTFSIGKTSF